LSRCRSIATLKTALCSLPPTLGETYSRILQQIANEEKAHVRRILEILCVAMRPIRLTEVAEIYQIGDDIQPPFTCERILFHPEDIIDICQGLLVLVVLPGDEWYTSQPRHPLKVLVNLHLPREESQIIIQLAHFSVKEYLLSSDCSPSWMLTEEISHISIIRTSLASFLEGTTALAPVEEEDSFIQIQRTLARYFSEYVSHHMDMLRPREHPALVPSFQVLFDNRLSYSDHIVDLWSRLSRTFLARTWVLSLICSGLPHQILLLAAFLGLSDTLRWLLSTERVPRSAIRP
jgi:hypothetical protein